MDAPKIQPVPFGTLLGYAPGGVAVYSSDYKTADPVKYPKRKSFRSYVDDIFMGYKWQCVEFARRWMYISRGYIFDDVSMAYEIFELRSVRDVNSDQRLPLASFLNGCKRRPEPGALLIWEEGGEFENTGHVAVVTEVFDDRLRVAEQNVDHYIWPEGQDFSRELRAQVSDEGDYWVECSYGDASILGWVIQTGDREHAEPQQEIDASLLNLNAAEVAHMGQTAKGWLNLANPDEAAYVQMMGGHKLTSVDEDQYRFYQMSETALDELESATNELHGLFMHATDYVLEHDELLETFNLPKAILPRIRQSWDNRLNQLITSRFDFSISERGLKVYEYNCDSASCYMECGKVQGKWGKHFGAKRGRDAGEDLFNDLVKAWRQSDAEELVHILRDDDPEETYHALFMAQAIEAAGLQVQMVNGLQDLVWDDEGHIRDLAGNKVRWVWKTWAWETALDQIRAEYEADDAMSEYEPRWQAGAHPRLVDVLLRREVMVYEPLWTLIPSNKAILPVLWMLFPNHPFLLNTSFELTDDLRQTGYVAKPIVGRCGHNIQLVDHQDEVLHETAGQFASRETIYQQLFPLPCVGGYFTQVSTFTAAGHYAGACVRVDKSMIISKDSDCMALQVLADEDMSWTTGLEE